MIYSTSKIPYAFIHNPSTSGTTLSKYFLWRGGTETDKAKIHSRYVDESALIGISDFYLFGFVRNPFSREASLFNMFRTHTGNSLSFESWIAKRFIERTDQNFTFPQYEFFCSTTGELKVNVFYFEKRKEAIAELASVLRFPEEQMLNYSPMVNSVRSPNIDYRTMYTTSMIDTVTPFFQLDMDAFGYDFEGYTGITKPVSHSITL